MKIEDNVISFEEGDEQILADIVEHKNLGVQANELIGQTNVLTSKADSLAKRFWANMELFYGSTENPGGDTFNYDEEKQTVTVSSQKKD